MMVNEVQKKSMDNYKNQVGNSLKYFSDRELRARGKCLDFANLSEVWLGIQSY